MYSSDFATQQIPSESMPYKYIQNRGMECPLRLKVVYSLSYRLDCVL